MAICVLLPQAWIAQPPAAMDMYEAILHLQYDFVVKVVKDFVLSNQSDGKIQAQEFTRTLSWSQINYLCTGQDDLRPAPDDTVLTSANPTGALTAGLVTDPETTLLLPKYQRLCKQVSWTEQANMLQRSAPSTTCTLGKFDVCIMNSVNTFMLLCTYLMHKGPA